MPIQVEECIRWAILSVQNNRTPATKSSIAVLSPRHDFCKGPSLQTAVGFFVRNQADSGRSHLVQIASYSDRVLFASPRKTFPSRVFSQFKRPLWDDRRNPDRYNLF